MFRLSEKAPLRVEHTGRAIPPFLDVGREGASDQCFAHCLCCRDEAVGDYCHRQGVEFPGRLSGRCHYPSSALSLRFACPSTRAPKPGGR